MAKDTPKSQIGKGIRALLTQIDERGAPPSGKEVLELSRTILEVPVNAIEVNPFQPRKDFDENALAELAQSISTHGIIQPLTLRRLHEGKYQIISGERRWRAAQKAGLTTVPAYIRVADDQGMLEMAILENIQRADLNVMEIAFSLQRLIDECKLTHEALAERVGKQRSSISNFLRLLKLPPRIQQALRSEEISFGHAKAIAGIDDVAVQLLALGEIISKGLNVRETEKWVADYQDKPNKGGSTATSGKSTSNQMRKSAEISRIEQHLREHFGVKAEIKIEKNKGGHIRIPFRNDDELNAILDIIDES